MCIRDSDSVFASIDVLKFVSITTQCIQQFHIDHKIFVEGFLSWNNTQYEWNFVQCSDEYFYILTPDNAKAVSISGTGDGSNLILKTFNAADDTQKWKKSSAGSNLYYIRPKAASTMTMDIEGPSTGSGAPIQIWTHNTSAAQFKWYVL